MLRQDIAERDEELEVLRAEIEAALREESSRTRPSSITAEVKAKTGQLWVLVQTRTGALVLVALFLAQALLHSLFMNGKYAMAFH